MRTTFTRRQIETTLAALLAAVTALIGLAGRDERPLGPKFLALEKVGRLTSLSTSPSRRAATSSTSSRSREG